MTVAYLPLDTFKAYRKVTRGVDPADDATIQAAIDAAGGAVNEATGRRWVVASASSARLFAGNCTDVLRIYDATAVTVVSVSGTALATTEYQLEPLNGLSATGESVPYTCIRRSGGWQSGYEGEATISVTATWGWATIPAQIVEACKILAKDVLANQDVSFGIAGFTEYAGVRARENPQVAMLLAPYRRVESFGIA